MSSNRLIYDKCAYSVELMDNNQKLDYNIFKFKYVNDNKCPLTNLPSFIAPEMRTEVESELYGLNRLLSSCPSNKYNPENNKFKPLVYSPARLCEGIYHMTPTGLEYLMEHK
jgi:hypothetical protein